MTRLQSQPAKRTTAAMPTGLNTIVVATDFSDNAGRALQWAIALGKSHQGQIVLVHAIEPTLAAVDFLEGQINEEIRKGLDRVQKTCADARVRASVEHKMGRPWQVIFEAAKKHDADLIVTGTRGRTGYKRVMLGSTADRLIRTSTIPVLVVHPNDQVPEGGLKRILAPVDFSEESSLATNMAVRLLSGDGRGAERGGEIILLHAIELLVEWPTPDMPTVMPRYWDDAETTAKRQLESIAASIRNDRIAVKAKTFRGYPPDAIDLECKTGGFDLIVMGTRGKGGVERFMLGSVVERVLHHVTCPVLTVRKPDSDAPARVST
jgi:nucleotide-binding universal stress UspA family protein